MPTALTIAASVLSAVIASYIIGAGQDADTSGRAISRIETKIEHLERDSSQFDARFERVFDRLRDLELQDNRRPERGRAGR